MYWQAEEGFLGDLKAYQDRVQLKDEMAVEVMQEAARAKLERHIGTALDCIKKRTRVRDYTPATQVCPVKKTKDNPTYAVVYQKGGLTSVNTTLLTKVSK